MKVRIKTQDGNALFYETSGAVAFDFKCTQDYTFEPGDFHLVETGTVVEIPQGYMLQIQPRSSTFKKHGLMQVNGVGIIDQDYCGEEDSIKFAYMNMTNKTQHIEKGTRIWQGVFVKIEKAEFEVVEKMWNDNSRWGFGTTGIK